MNEAQIEAGAFAIFRRFIGNLGVVPIRQKTDRQGRPLTWPDGRPFMETQDEAAARRWRTASERTRNEFRQEAADCLAAAEEPYAA